MVKVVSRFEQNYSLEGKNISADIRIYEKKNGSTSCYHAEVAYQLPNMPALGKQNMKYIDVILNGDGKNKAIKKVGRIIKSDISMLFKQEVAKRNSPKHYKKNHPNYSGRMS